MDTNSTASDSHVVTKKFRRLRRVFENRRSDEEMVPPEGPTEDAASPQAQASKHESELDPTLLRHSPPRDCSTTPVTDPHGQGNGNRAQGGQLPGSVFEAGDAQDAQIVDDNMAKSVPCNCKQQENDSSAVELPPVSSDAEESVDERESAEKPRESVAPAKQSYPSEKGRKLTVKDAIPCKKRRQTVLLQLDETSQQASECRQVNAHPRRSLRIGCSQTDPCNSDRCADDLSDDDAVHRDVDTQETGPRVQLGKCQTKVEDSSECPSLCNPQEVEAKGSARKRTRFRAEEGMLPDLLKARRSRVTAKGMLLPEAPEKPLRSQEAAESKDPQDEETAPRHGSRKPAASLDQLKGKNLTATARDFGQGKQPPSRRHVNPRKQPILSYSASDASIERLHREATASSLLWQTPGDSELRKVPTEFSSVEEYIGVFEPLLFEECRAQLRSVWEELADLHGKDVHSHVNIRTVHQRDRGWYDLTVLPVDKHVRLFFKEGDVAVVSTPKPGSVSRRKGRQKGDDTRVVDACRVSGTIRRFVPVDTREPHGAILHFYVPSDSGNLESVLRQLQQVDMSWYLTIIGSVTTTQREYVALHKVHHLHSQALPAPLFCLDSTLPVFKAANLLMIEAILQPRPELFPSHTLQTPPAMPECFTPPFLQHLQNHFNGPQLEAIQWAAAHTAAGMGGTSNTGRQEPWPFTLVQGPPGTGKTHTVWGMLNVIHLVQYQRYYAALVQKLAPGSLLPSEEPSTSSVLDSREHSSGSIDEVLQRMDNNLTQNLSKPCPKPRMLVCAPSNAATDELLARVLDRGFMDGEMRIYRPDVARVGTDSQSRAAQAVSVERRTENLLNRQREEIVGWLHQLRMKEVGLTQNILGLKKGLLEIVKSLRSSATIGVDPEVLAVRDQARDAQNYKLQQLAAAVEERDKVLTELARLLIVENRFRGPKEGSYEDARRKLEASFANEAEIVFTTVSSTGRRLFSELTHGFDMVVIDEAAQASEVAVLPPLSLRSSRCVLVGDPQQLPATVISHVANNMQYSRSLFERFQKAGCPATVLTVQYRMHPEIREFPSEHFYKGQLTDSESIRASPSEVYHSDPLLRPYLFFDINIGRESHGGSVSYQNTLEAQVVVRLYLHLQNVLKIAGVHESAVSVGIITPYKQQLSCLQKEFQAVVGANPISRGVYINTVDAFQGQERDVIIMSCVRASSHGVGFVADVRRMNVALTRARRSLLVIGNAKALSQSDDWTALIKNARVRECFVPAAFLETNGLLTEQPMTTTGTGSARYRRAPGGWEYQSSGGHCSQTDASDIVIGSHEKSRHR